MPNLSRDDITALLRLLDMTEDFDFRTEAEIAVASKIRNFVLGGY